MSNTFPLAVIINSFVVLLCFWGTVLLYSFGYSRPTHVEQASLKRKDIRVLVLEASTLSTAKRPTHSIPKSEMHAVLKIFSLLFWWTRICIIIVAWLTFNLFLGIQFIQPSKTELRWYGCQGVDVSRDRGTAGCLTYRYCFVLCIDYATQWSPEEHFIILISEKQWTPPYFDNRTLIPYTAASLLLFVDF